jgi:hypothetical protein
MGRATAPPAGSAAALRQSTSFARSLAVAEPGPFSKNRCRLLQTTSMPHRWAVPAVLRSGHPARGLRLIRTHLDRHTNCIDDPLLTPSLASPPVEATPPRAAAYGEPPRSPVAKTGSMPPPRAIAPSPCLPSSPASQIWPPPPLRHGHQGSPVSIWGWKPNSKWADQMWPSGNSRVSSFPRNFSLNQIQVPIV